MSGCCPTTDLEPNNTIVICLYTTKVPVDISVNASFFETNGWTATKRKYTGIFNPITGWAKKSTGELYIAWDGDPQRTKCSLKAMLDHGLCVLNGYNNHQPDSPEEDEAPVTPKNGKQPAVVDPNKTQSYGGDSSDTPEVDSSDDGKR